MRLLWRIRYCFVMFFHYGIAFVYSWPFSADWYDTMRKDDETMKKSAADSFRFLK